MLYLLRKIRQKLLSNNKVGTYLLYAIGEIILVVVGILIAVSIDNWKTNHNQKAKEIKHLQNIQIDLRKDVERLTYLIQFRKNRILGDQKIIDHINGEPVNDLTVLTKMVVNSAMEEKFTPSNIAFTELLSSGNFNIITSDSIKILLLKLQELYKIHDSNVLHEQWDYREYVSKSVFKNTNMEQLFPIYAGLITAEQQGITINEFARLFELLDYKNGLFVMTVMSEAFVQSYEDIQSKSNTIILLIDSELYK